MLKPFLCMTPDKGDANYSANGKGRAEFCVALDVVHGWGLSSGCVGLTKATQNLRVKAQSLDQPYKSVLRRLDVEG
jgi:hypothetical protein